MAGPSQTQLNQRTEAPFDAVHADLMRRTVEDLERRTSQEERPRVADVGVEFEEARKLHEGERVILQVAIAFEAERAKRGQFGKSVRDVLGQDEVFGRVLSEAVNAEAGEVAEEGEDRNAEVGGRAERAVDELVEEESKALVGEASHAEVMRLVPYAHLAPAQGVQDLVQVLVERVQSERYVQVGRDLGDELVGHVEEILGRWALSCWLEFRLRLGS